MDIIREIWTIRTSIKQFSDWKKAFSKFICLIYTSPIKQTNICSRLKFSIKQAIDRTLLFNLISINYLIEGFCLNEDNSINCFIDEFYLIKLLPNNCSNNLSWSNFGQWNDLTILIEFLVNLSTKQFCLIESQSTDWSYNFIWSKCDQLINLTISFIPTTRYSLNWPLEKSYTDFDGLNKQKFERTNIYIIEQTKIDKSKYMFKNNLVN